MRCSQSSAQLPERLLPLLGARPSLGLLVAGVELAIDQAQSQVVGSLMPAVVDMLVGRQPREDLREHRERHIVGRQEVVELVCLGALGESVEVGRAQRVGEVLAGLCGHQCSSHKRMLASLLAAESHTLYGKSLALAIILRTSSVP